VVVAAFLLAVLGMAVYTSFIKFWPYDKSMSLRHYTFGLVDAGVIVSFFNSLRMAILTAVLGTMFIFMVAYLLEKTRGMAALEAVVRLLATIDGSAGMVLGWATSFLQPADQSAERAVRHDGYPGAVDDRALLLVEPPDGGDGAEADRQRVRVGVGLAEGAVLQDILAGHSPGVPAVDPRHWPLLFRQRDDDNLGGRVPVFAEDDTGIDLDPATGRSGCDRLRGSDGDADRTQAWRNTAPR
jgi:hypothetical protein